MIEPDHPLIADLKKEETDRRARVESVQQASHARDAVLDAAGADLIPVLVEWRKRHGLTSLEYLWILQAVSRKHLTDAIQAERAGVK